MKIRKLLLCFLLSILLLPHISYGVNSNPKVYLVVMNKLTLKDIESMDNLKAIINNGSIGLMNTRGTLGYTGPESFLTINSSNKAYGDYNSVDFQSMGVDNTIINNSFSTLINLNKDNNYLPTIGAIGDNLHNSGLKTAIYGNNDLMNMNFRTSALIPMDSKGLVDYGNIDNITIEEKDYPFGLKTNYQILLNEIMKSPADFIVADTGDLERVFWYSSNLTDIELVNTRRKVLLDIDKFIKELTSLLDHENSLMIITSPNSGDPSVDNNKLAPLILWGRGIEKGSMISPTTRREGIVTNLDIGPTIMKFLNATQDNMVGSPIETIKKDINLKDIIIQSQQINTTSTVRYNTLYYYVLASIIILFLAIVLKLAKIRITEKIEKIIKILLISLIFIPNIFIAISLFKPINIYNFILILLVLILFIFVLLWKTIKNNNYIIYIYSFSVFLIILDLILKGSISQYSVLSYDPIIGARYYGIGNEMVGLLLGTVTILSIKLLGKNNKSLVPLFLFIISLVLVGHPNYGANVGGAMTFVVATVFYIMGFLNKDLSIKRIFFVVISIMVFISIMGYVDITTNINTTHLGNAILLIKNKGLSYLNSIVLRKILMNIKLIGRSFWTYLLLFIMFFHAIMFNSFKNMEKKVFVAITAGIAGAMGGFLLNDSGLILAAISMNLITTGLYLEYI